MTAYADTISRPVKTLTEAEQRALLKVTLRRRLRTDPFLGRREIHPRHRGGLGGGAIVIQPSGGTSRQSAFDLFGLALARCSPMCCR